MPANWKALAREEGFRVSADDTIEVSLGASKQVIHVEADSTADALRLWSVIATRRTLDQVAGDQFRRYAWERNRFSDLVGFTVDRKLRLLGESWIPLANLDSVELSLHLSELARVCDWHEFRLTGADEH